MKRVTAILACGFLASGVLGAGPGSASMAKSESSPRQATKPGSATDELIRGLDGGLYSPYRPSVIRSAQDVLKQEGLYSGARDGVLDDATMQALGEFQKQHGMVVSGIPTPRTRKELAQEAHGVGSASAAAEAGKSAS